MITDKDIIEYCFIGDKFNFHALNRIIKQKPDYLEYLKNRYVDSDSLKETIYRIKHNIETKPVCPVCGNPLPFKGRLYSKHCSTRCSSLNKETINKRQETALKLYGDRLYTNREKSRQTCKEKYGDEYYTNRQKSSNTYHSKSKEEKQEIINKIKHTKFEKYGDENYTNVEKTKQTNLARYGKECTFQVELIRDKIKQTCLDKYGVENGGGSIQAIKKIKETKLKRYGSENYNNIEKIKQTNLDKYVVECTLQSEEIQNKIKQTNLYKYGVEYLLQSKEIQNKIKQTCLEKYGVEYAIQSEQVKNKSRQTCLEKYGYEYAIQSKEIQQKAHETIKKNGSYGKSKEEDYVYSVLVDIYGNDNVKRQYKSNLYPFACDFYIISEDLYIEYNGMWTHGHTPYIGSKENETQLEKWKQKAITSDYYKRAILIWTISDVKKRNTAKKNELNYI